MLPLPPSATLFPYTTLFRSQSDGDLSRAAVADARRTADELLGPTARGARAVLHHRPEADGTTRHDRRCSTDRKSTRLNSSHANISYAVFCLKKKKNRKSK